MRAVNLLFGQTGGFKCLIIAITASAFLMREEAGAAKASGPLRVSKENPRYFTDGSGKAIYLAGHQVFVDAQDDSWAVFNMPDGSATFDWNWYLDYAVAHDFNYLRNWILWSSSPTFWNMAKDSSPASAQRRTHPMPFLRTGPGLALDGRPKFDLDRWDEAFWSRLRRRVGEAQQRGIYVSVMLFETFGFLANKEAYPRTLWSGNMFHAPNNINGLDADPNGDREGFEFFNLSDNKITKRQQAYLRKMVDTLNDLDNVIWEICNEPPNTPETISWLKAMVRYLKEYEARQPHQHLLLMTPGGSIPGGGWRNMAKEDVLSIGEDCYTVAGAWGEFTQGNPPPASTISAELPGIVDLDHVSPGSTSMTLPWEVLTRGYGGYSLYDHPFEHQKDESPIWELVRRNIGATRRYADQFADLGRMKVRGDLSSTGFCLANPGADYLVFLPRAGEVATVDLSDAAAAMVVEWFRPATCKSFPAPKVQGGGKHTFKPPFDGDAVLYLKAQ
jgi:hypothetical protein